MGLDKLKIGHIITTPQQRDAVHMAVAPVIAGEVLNPGAHVGMVSSGRFARNGKHIGVVDPFLKRNVKTGDEFWLFIYPGSITSLRHDWEHPDMMEAERKELSPLQKAEAWIAKYAEELGVEPDELKDAAYQYVKHRDYWVQGGRFEGWGIRAEFWDHYEVIHGEHIPHNQRVSFFSCSC